MEEFETNESNIYYLKESPIRKAIAHLSIPMMVGISATTIYNLINAYFMGLIHDTNMMSAITLAMPITIILMAVGNVFGVGGGTFITRLLGSGDKEKGKKSRGLLFLYEYYRWNHYCYFSNDFYDAFCPLAWSRWSNVNLY